MSEGDEQILLHCLHYHSHRIPDPDPVPPLRHSNHISRPPDRYGFSHTSLLATLSSISIPKSYSHGVKHEFWQRAMQDELDAL